ncbi:MAG: DUF1330 domain-containing protein [Flavobacteriales bacterium]|nr:DUF1330 domain-containing protein [Flavobacteriales bacterium]
MYLRPESLRRTELRLLLELEIIDKSQLEEYKKLAPATLKAHQGKLIVRGGQQISLEGNWNPERMVIIEFPSVEIAKEWYHSKAYQEASVFRNKATKTRMIILAG